MLLRPEQIELTDLADSAPDASDAAGIVEGADYYGHDTMLAIRLDEPHPAMISLRHTGTDAPVVGARVRLRVRGVARWYPAG